MRRTRSSLAAVAAGSMLVIGLAGNPLGVASAAPRPSDPPPRATGGSSDVRELSPDERTKPSELDRSVSPRELRRAKSDPGRPPEVGDQRTWVGSDDVYGDYFKRFQLRGVGDNVQVWVANDRAFPTDDCRNDLGLTEVTQKQIDRFIGEFSDNIYRKETRVFSSPPDRNGSGSADFAQSVGLPAGYWKVGKKQSDDIVVLIDNVRDSNFYTPTAPDGQTYIAGFFSPTYNEVFDRNIMTIDVFDWLHRTGTNPPDDSDDPDFAACAEDIGGPSAKLGDPRPDLYEGVFAHEFQHLLEFYEDRNEVSWVNEGLSDWAMDLTGYARPELSPRAPLAERHLQCFDGFLPRSFGGPENSLSIWGDQGDPEILCDYGAANSMMEYLYSHYGRHFMSALHRNNGNGLRGLQRVLDAFKTKLTSQRVLHRWAAMMAVDGKLDHNGGDLVGANPGALTADSLQSYIKWSNPQAFSAPGAPPNGSDYVRLRDGQALSADEIDSIEFQGDDTVLGQPVEWETDTTPPASTDADTVCGEVPDGPGPAALYSGCGDDLDRSLVREVDVPSGSPTLSFDALWDIEETWDFGFVQVSDDGGETWKSLPTEDTSSTHDPDADPAIVAQLPGLSGDSGTWQTETADLSDYAGKTVLLGFRYMTDGAAAEGGFWVRNIDVEGQSLPTDADGWQTMSQVNPHDVAGWTVQLVSYGGRGEPVRYKRLKLDSSFTGELTGAALRKAIGDTAPVVAAIVMQDDPTETSPYPAGYQLTVNGVTQPGGGEQNP